MVNLNNILENLLESQSDWRIKLFQKWDSIVGTLKAHICLEKIEGSTIIIGVYESHWMQELYLMSNIIIKQINASIEGSKINSVKFKLAPLQKFDKINKFKKLNRKSMVDIKMKNFSLNKTQENALNKIEDLKLKECLLHYYYLVKSQEHDN